VAGIKVLCRQGNACECLLLCHAGGAPDQYINVSLHNGKQTASSTPALLQTGCACICATCEARPKLTESERVRAPGDLHFYMRHSFRPAPAAPPPSQARASEPPAANGHPPRGRQLERGLPRAPANGLAHGRGGEPPRAAAGAAAAAAAAAAKLGVGPRRGTDSSASSESLTGASSLASSDDEAAAAQLSGLYSELAGLVGEGARALRRAARGRPPALHSVPLSLF